MVLGFVWFVSMVTKMKADKRDKPDKNAKGSKKIGNGFSYLNGFAVYCIILNYL